MLLSGAVQMPSSLCELGYTCSLTWSSFSGYLRIYKNQRSFVFCIYSKYFWPVGRLVCATNV